MHSDDTKRNFMLKHLPWAFGVNRLLEMLLAPLIARTRLVRLVTGAGGFPLVGLDNHDPSRALL